MKRVVVLGSTGSIGTQTLDVISRHLDKFEVVGLAAGKNASLLKEQADRFNVKNLALFDGSDSRIPSGMSALVDLAQMQVADLVVISVAGVIGLEPTLAAIDAGKQIALASKEVLVSAGQIVMCAAQAKSISVLPIDSEHSAIFQCLAGSGSSDVDSIIITASGGPFRGKTRAELEDVSVASALNHPTWRMGGKITIDSATLMNKGLEAIEARWLFNVEMPKVEVVVHPQSVVHSMVRFRDGSVLGQMGWPDMRLPILFALNYPHRTPSGLERWDPIRTPQLTFEKVDEATFPAIRLARHAMAQGGTMPCVLNAANEEAANAFLKEQISFLKITEIVESTMLAHSPETPSLDILLELDQWARSFARTLI